MMVILDILHVIKEIGHQKLIIQLEGKAFSQ